jgi:hypothetical protein
VPAPRIASSSGAEFTLRPVLVKGKF